MNDGHAFARFRFFHCLFSLPVFIAKEGRRGARPGWDSSHTNRNGPGGAHGREPDGGSDPRLQHLRRHDGPWQEADRVPGPLLLGGPAIGVGEQMLVG